MKKTYIKAKLNGVDYKIYFGAFDGLCSPPKLVDREAEIHLTHGFKKDRYTMELLIHECIHSCLWKLSEDDVERTAEDISKVLWRIYNPRKEIK